MNNLITLTLKKSNLIKKWVLIYGLMASSTGWSMGQQPPHETNPPPASTPLPTIRTPSSPALSDLDSKWNINFASEVTPEISKSVDSYNHESELLKIRNSNTHHDVDICDVHTQNLKDFGDRISYYIQLHMKTEKTPIEYVAEYFQIPTKRNDFYPVSLISHEMCEVTPDTLSQTMDGRKMPSAAAIQKANKFVTIFNDLRTKALGGDRTSYLKIEKLYSKMMACLAYTESLTTADTSRSDNVSSRYAPSDYQRPSGVLFYEDPYQVDIESKLNIGLYQFGAYSSGDTQGCLRQWNETYPTCQMKLTSSNAEMIRITGSTYQSFNAFCGVNSILQNFSVQVNTTNSQRTHPANRLSAGLKKPEDRCVSFHFSSKMSYNHFGPLQNVMGTTIDELLSCTLKE